MFNFDNHHSVKVIIYMLSLIIRRKKNVFCIIAIIFIFFNTSCSSHHEKMPDFKFFTTQRQWLSSNEMKDKNIVVIYFNSGCEFCQDEMADILAHNNAFKQKNVQFVFISIESLSGLQHFTSIFAYDTIPNWTFAHVSPRPFRSSTRPLRRPGQV